MIITQSQKLQKLISLAKKVAASSAPILLSGESGTGKELFAQLIHQASSRAGERLVRVNCAALPGNLIESELFGHERGSFTDAVATRIGRFELAGGGTLFLDEISEVPLATQAKLLRVLESNEFERVGSSEPIRHDVRIIAATNRDLLGEVENESFRLDLYHRINVVQVRIPPLRNRTEDVPVLAMHFLKRYREENSIDVKGFTSEAMKALAGYPWPGNVRELRNTVHRACILTEQPLIERECLELPQKADAQSQASHGTLPERWFHTELADIEREVILAAIARFGKREVVAKKLGVSVRTISSKIKQYREHQTARLQAA